MPLTRGILCFSDYGCEDETHIANVNPIRYRGYFYDTETKLYYCNSRYYDPQVKRFINADVLLSTGTGFLGYNMFAYCGNNPVLFTDQLGERYCAETVVSKESDTDRSAACAHQKKVIDEKNIFDPTLRPGKLPYYEPATPNFLPTDLSVVEQSIALDLADDYMSGCASQLPKKIYFDTIVNVDGVPIHLESCVPNYTAKALQSFSSTVEVAQFASEIYGNYKYHNGLNRDFFIESSIDLGKSVAGFAAGAAITASSMSLIPAIVAGAATAYGIHEFGEWLKRKFVY